MLLDSEPSAYEPSAVRWLARFLLERRRRSLREAEAVAANLSALCEPQTARPAALELSEHCRAAGLERAASQLGRRFAGR